MAKFTEIYATIEDELTMDFEECPMDKDADDWSEDHKKYLVSIDYDCNTLETYYHTRLYPDVYDVFACIVLDARVPHEKTFLDFCLEYGYETDCPKVIKLYKDCEEQKEKLLDLLGDELFQQFMECEIDW